VRNCRLIISILLGLLLLILSHTGSAAKQNNGNGDKWGLNYVCSIYIRRALPVESSRNAGITEIREKDGRAAEG
jgi:hypothetical protein